MQGKIKLLGFFLKKGKARRVERTSSFRERERENKPFLKPLLSSSLINWNFTNGDDDD